MACTSLCVSEVAALLKTQQVWPEAFPDTAKQWQDRKEEEAGGAGRRRQAEDEIKIKENLAETARSGARSSTPFGTFWWRGLNPIKPVYDPDQPDGQLTVKSQRL